MAQIYTDPYLFFNGNCREAMEFYKSIFGGKLDISPFDENVGDMPDMKEMKGKVMHALLSGGKVRLMASDSRQASPKMAKVELSISGGDGPVLRKFFKELSEGGTVRMPLQNQSWGAEFGMLTDKFNIDWMVNIDKKGA